MKKILILAAVAAVVATVAVLSLRPGGWLAASEPSPAPASSPTNPPPRPAPANPATTNARSPQDLVLDTVEALRRMPEPGTLRFDNPEIIRLLDEVARRERAVRDRQAELDFFSARIAAEHAALRGMTQQVVALQKQLELELDRRENAAAKARVDAVEESARQWRELPPAQAARLATNLPPAEAAGILAAMPPEASARVFEALGRAGTNGTRQMAEVFRALAERNAPHPPKP